MDGWTDDVVKAFEKYLTPYGDGKLNIKVVPEEILYGMFADQVPTEQRLEKAKELNDLRVAQKFTAKDFFKTMAKEMGYEEPSDLFQKDLVSKSDTYITTSSRVFRIVATGTQGTSKRVITAVVDRGSNVTDADHIYYYQMR